MQRLLVLIFTIPLFVSCFEKQQVRIATYNIYFLDDGINAGRKAQLRTVISELNADVIGFQEINNPSALKNILPSEYTIVMIDDPDEVQEVALAFREPFRLISHRYVFPDPTHDDAFPRSRNLLEVVTMIDTAEIVFLVHHFKSRSGGRLKTDVRRETASAMIVEHIKTELAGRNVVLLCDMNDNPDDRSANILEYGNPEAEGGPDPGEDTFLFNVTESILEKDYCSYGLNYIFEEAAPGTFKFRVPGSREENNKWRGKKHDFFKDVKIKAVLMDQILVSLPLKAYLSESGILKSFSAVRGERSKVRFTEKGIEYTNRGTLASDHVPVWALFSFTP